MAFNLGTIWAEIGLNTKKLDDGLMKAQTKLAAADKEINTMGQKLTLASTKMLTAGGIMAGAVAGIGVASIKMAKEFDSSMRNVNSIAKLSEQEFADMSQKVIKLSTKLPQSAKVLADGLYDISSSGFAGAEGLKVLEASAIAASAGMTDTATSAKGITAVLNAYGMSAEDAMGVADTMFATVDKGVITFEELAGGIGNVISTANLASISFNELSGMIAYMTTKGVSADETMTALNRLIMSIIQPSDALAAVLKNAGYESGELAIKQLGLVGVLGLMEEASGGSLTKLQEMSPEMRALKASGALLGSGIEELTDFMGGFADNTGKATTALNEQMKSLDKQLELLQNNFKAIGITLGSELIPNVTKATGGLTEWISKNNELAATLVKVIGGVIGGGGGLLMLSGLIGKIRGLMMTTAGSVGVIGTAFVVFNGAVDALAESLDNSDRKSGQLEGTLLRMLAPLTMLTDGMKENVTIAQALADGYLSASEAGHVNIFTIQKYLELIKERKAKEDEINNGTLPSYISLIDQKTQAEEVNIITLQKHAKSGAEMAAEVNKSADSVLRLTEALNNLPDTQSILIELEYRTRGYTPGIFTSNTEFGLAYDVYGKKAMGGIIGYANGSIIGNPIPKAAGGMVVPQTGREVPIIAHEGEVILNSSQQGNLAEAIWGVANGKGSGGGINNNFYISELVVREEADVNRIADELYNMQKSKQIGAGIR